MIAPVDSVGRLVSIIQAQLASRTGTGARPAGSGRERIPSANATSIESLIAQRIRNISRDDPRRGRKAFRLFLESVLLARLGEQLMHDPKFYGMVDSVQHVMEADRELHALVQAAIEQLLSADPARDD